MKKFFRIIGLCTALMVVGTTAHAQKCKYDYEKADEFTGAAAKGITVKLTSYWYSGLNRVGDDYHIGILIRLAGEVSHAIEKGDSISFKLSTGEIITCYSKNRYESDRQAQATATSQTSAVASYISTFRAEYTVTQEQMEAFASSAITNVRMYIGGAIQQIEAKEKVGKKFQEAANCMLK